jgi:hypothetical protein
MFAKYSWTQVQGPKIILDSANTSIATFTVQYNLSTDTTLAFRLIAKDDKNATGADDVKVIDIYISHPNPNQHSIANANINQTVNVGNNVTLDNSGAKNIVFL